MLRFLKEQEYGGVLAIEEGEERRENQMPRITKSVAAMRRSITTVDTTRQTLGEHS